MAIEAIPYLGAGFQLPLGRYRTALFKRPARALLLALQIPENNPTWFDHSPGSRSDPGAGLLGKPAPRARWLVRG